MSAKRFLPLALAALVTTLGPARSDEAPVGTGERGGDTGGWKGLPGAKDPGEPGKSPGWIEVELKITPVEKDWAFRTPRDSEKVGKTNTGAWVDVSDGTLPMTGVKGGPIRFQPLNNRNMLDSDGDGTYETAISGEFLAAKVKRPDGTEGVHYFRLRRDGQAYVYNRACMAIGKIDDTPVSFIDENNNGIYGDPSADAMHIGSSPVAQYTSEVINIKNKLYCLRVNQSGTTCWYKAYEGPSGKIDLASKYRGKDKTKPLFVMLQQGEIIIDAAAADTVLPAGTWSVFEGLVGPSMFQCAKMKPGKMQPIVVKKDETASLAWGMPGIIDFSVTKNGNQVKISGSSVRIYGQGGEEYVNFRPKKFTPNVEVVEEASKKGVYNGNMGAGC